jgi:hypothetical protein
MPTWRVGSMSLNLMVAKLGPTIVERAVGNAWHLSSDGTKKVWMMLTDSY